MQSALFYEFSLDRHVPDDRMVRALERFVDLAAIRAHLRPFYSDLAGGGRRGADHDRACGRTIRALRRAPGG